MNTLLGRFRRAMQSLNALPRSAEIAIWVIVIAAVFGIRAYLFHLFPTYIWSDDSKSYLKSAFVWMDEGTWHTQPRRGPTYSAFVTACVVGTGELKTTVVVQHVIGAIGVLAAIALLRVWFGRAALVPLLFCGISYGLYDLPVYLEHLIRNETLLFFFASIALVALALGLRFRSPAWFAVTGLSAACLSVTKDIFGPFPIVVPIVIVALNWKQWRPAAIQAGVFLIAFAAPLGVLRAYYALSSDDVAPTSYAGVQLYGRVAQFTRLDGGVYPELKVHIRPLVEQYQARKKLDNNWVIKRGIIPEIGRFLGGSGEGSAGLRTVDPVCRQLAIEAIRTHPGAYAAQVWHDLKQLELETGFGERLPEVKGLKNLHGQLARMENPHWTLHRDETVQIYAERAKNGQFDWFHGLTRLAAIFELLPPVLMTSLLIPILILITRGDQRMFWIAAAAVWYFNILLLCTVGRPLHRYMIPLSPVMFLAISAALIRFWQLLAGPALESEGDELSDLPTSQA